METTLMATVDPGCYFCKMNKQIEAQVDHLNSTQLPSKQRIPDAEAARQQTTWHGHHPFPPCLSSVTPTMQHEPDRPQSLAIGYFWPSPSLSLCTVALSAFLKVIRPPHQPSADAHGKAIFRGTRASSCTGTAALTQASSPWPVGAHHGVEGSRELQLLQKL